MLPFHAGERFVPAKPTHDFWFSLSSFLSAFQKLLATAMQHATFSALNRHHGLLSLFSSRLCLPFRVFLPRGHHIEGTHTGPAPEFRLTAALSHTVSAAPAFPSSQAECFFFRLLFFFSHEPKAGTYRSRLFLFAFHRRQGARLRRRSCFRLPF